MSWRSLAAYAAAAADRTRPAGTGSAESGAASSVVAGVPGHTGHAAALAPTDRRAPLDLPAPAARPTAARHEVRELLLRLARENSHWGYVRIVGELRKLEITVSATLVRNVLARSGIPPAPQRDQLSWRSFLRQHAETVLPCDFFTVDTVWLRRLYVLFFVSIGTRRVEYLACTRNPNATWTAQQARNLLMDLDERGQRPRS